MSCSKIIVLVKGHSILEVVILKGGEVRAAIMKAFEAQFCAEFG